MSARKDLIEAVERARREYVIAEDAFNYRRRQLRTAEHALDRLERGCGSCPGCGATSNATAKGRCLGEDCEAVDCFWDDDPDAPRPPESEDGGADG